MDIADDPLSGHLTLVNWVAAEFQFFEQKIETCFMAVASSCNRGILRLILGMVGGRAPCLFVIGI